MNCGLCGETSVSPGWPVCASCCEPRESAGRPVLVAPPHVMAVKAKSLLPSSLITSVLAMVVSLPCVIGIVVAALAAPDSLRIVIIVAGVVPLAIGLVFGVVFGPHLVTRGRLLNAAHSQWRDHIIETLELGEFVQSTEPELHFGLFCEGAPGFFALVPRWDAAVVMAWPGGVGIFGAHRSRRFFTRDQIAHSVVERLWVYPPRMAWKINEGDELVIFASMDEPDFPSAAQRVRDLHERYGT